MPAFQYVAVDKLGQETKGVLEGDSEKQIRQLLRQKQLTPLSVKAVKEKKASTSVSFSRRQRLSQSDLTLFTRQLATLLNAGMPLEETLQATAEQTEKQKVKSIILAVRSRVLEGHSLATGLRDFPESFSNLYAATVAAGEHSGKLDHVLERLADYIEKQQAMKQKVQQAMIYPAIMTTVSVLIVIFLMIYVVPKMVNVFTSADQQLPMMTTALIGFSHGLQHYGIYILIAIILAFIGIKTLLSRSENARIKFHSIILSLPLVGKSVRVVNTARFSRTLGILSGSGVPILDAMSTASNLVNNIPMHNAMVAATHKVREGLHINKALKQTKFFPPMSLHLIASGESSGQLEAMLERAADNQDNEMTRLIDTLLTLFEPLLILVMGAIVLFIVMAILLPVFSLNQFTG